MPKKIFFSLVIACYNESTVFEKSMPQIVSVLQKIGKPCEIILVEDKSKDNTAELIRTFAKKNSFVRTVFHAQNRGRGAAVMDGFKIARGKITGFIDIDLEVSANFIPDAIKQLESGFDVVIGNRKPVETSFFRTFLHYAYAGLASFLLGLPLQDTNAGFKFFKTNKIKQLLPFLHEHHWFWDAEVLLKAHLAGFSICELPVIYKTETAKKSTVKFFSDSWHFLSKTLEYAAKIPQIKKELGALHHEKNKNLV